MTAACSKCGEYEARPGGEGRCWECDTAAEKLEAMVAPALGDLLDEVEGFVGRFVSFQNDHQAAAVALWIVHCYAIDAAPAAAYLRITSAVEESGKTQTCEVLNELLGEHAINAVSATPAAVFRIRDKLGPVALILDEIDQTLRDRSDDGARDLLAIVNSGYRRSAVVLRSVGQSHQPQAFRAFGPCAIAGLGSLHPTTESRCIPIVLERKPRGDGERWFPHLMAAEIQALRDRLEGWASTDMIDTLRAAVPNIPAELRDRHAEIWWALFAIADAAGGAWPERARRAAVILHGGRDAETASRGVLLLTHLRQAFEDAATDRLTTAALLRRLVAEEEGPWGKWWGAEVEARESPRAAASELAKMLRPFNVRPRVIRLPDGTTPRGYLLDEFADAWGRYLPPSGGGATHATHATPLASTVASVASVAGGPDGESCPDCGAHTPSGHAMACPQAPRSIIERRNP